MIECSQALNRLIITDLLFNLLFFFVCFFNPLNSNFTKNSSKQKSLIFLVDSMAFSLKEMMLDLFSLLILILVKIIYNFFLLLIPYKTQPKVFSIFLTLVCIESLKWTMFYIFIFL